MDAILVISNEPALGETLASELGEISALQAGPKELASQSGPFRLIVADEGIDESTLGTLPTEAKAPVLRLIRPVRLSALLYTIREKLQSKTAHEDLGFAPGWRLVPAERLLRSDAGDARITLTEKETELLICLQQQQDTPIARDAILRHVWGYSDDIATHTLETHIYRLRGKLRQANETFDIVFSEDGGYRLSLA